MDYKAIKFINGERMSVGESLILFEDSVAEWELISIHRGQEAGDMVELRFKLDKTITLRNCPLYVIEYLEEQFEEGSKRGDCSATWSANF